MPELPEVENLKLGLEKNILKQKILKITINYPKVISSRKIKQQSLSAKKREFLEGATGEKFLKIERRAKNIIFYLSHNKILLGHLKMTGQFIYKSKKAGEKIIVGGHPIEISEKILPNKHSHIIFELEKGNLYYNDIRKFGYLLYFPSLEKFKKEIDFKNYGPEPLEKEFTLKYFINSLKKNKSKIKSALLSQKIVVGLGNIYVDESLFQAKILPQKISASLSEKEIQNLYQAIIKILNKAIKMGGSSVATYRLLDNTRGNYAREHKVYGLSGKKCINCQEILQKTIIQGRTTVFCSNCQK